MGLVPQDVRYAFRTLFKAPAFTLVVVATLALGIGANTAIFTLMDQVLLRALPVKDPQQLVILDAKGSNMGRIEGDHAFSYPMLKDFREQSKTTGVLGRFRVPTTLMVDNRSERVLAELVSGNYFQVFGLTPAAGRLLDMSDEVTPEGHPVVVLSHAFWLRRFAGSPAVVGRTIRINGLPMTVAGVAPRGFNGAEVGTPTDLFVPLMMRMTMIPSDPKDALMDRRTMWLQLVARVKDGVPKEQAEAELNTIFRHTREEELKAIPSPTPRFRKGFLGTHLNLLPGYKGLSSLREQFSTPVVVLMGMVGLVLLITCANVANLLMARAPARQREIAVRLALGASRARVVGQLLIESVVLALFGGALGVILSIWAADSLLHALPFEGIARSFSSSPDIRILLFTLGVSCLTGLVFGLVPAWQTAKPGIVLALREEGGAVVSSGHVRLRKGLVVAQVVLSLLLLVGAGLFTRSLWNLRSLDPGFRVDSLLTFSVDPSLSGYSPEAANSFYERLQQRLGQLPGVTAVSMVGNLPLTGNTWMATVKVEGYQGKDGEDLNPMMNVAGPGYFKTMGVPILAGRDLLPSDGAAAPKVAVINEKMAQYFFGNQNPIGRHFGIGRAKGNEIEIVGVAKDGKDTDLRQPVSRGFYLPFAQFSDVGAMTLLVRAGGQPPSGDALRRAVAQIDAVIPVFDIKSMRVVSDESLFVDRMFALLSACFGGLAMVLAAVGLYGVMSYTVARRTREIGVRMALGAQPTGVIWLVMREVALLALVGIAIGLPAAIGVGHLVSSQLYGVSPTDPATLIVATLTLLTVALLAGYVPAGQATRIDPIKALRWE